MSSEFPSPALHGFDESAESPVVVQKFGGSSLSCAEKLAAVARRVVATRRRGVNVVVVVSAMGSTTDDLLAKAAQVTESPDPRELDMLLCTGERVTIALLAMAIREQGEKAVSLTGAQAGFVTDDRHNAARILEVRPFRIESALAEGAIPVVAGYQGASYRGEVTTFGRGGSDTTAVALAAALGAQHCDIFSDVDGVYSGDPRVIESAHRLQALCYDEMRALARHGARVLNEQAVEFARERGIAVYTRSTFGSDAHTLVRRRDGILDEQLRRISVAGVTGVAGREDLLAVRYAAEPGRPSLADAVLRALEGVDLLDTRVDAAGRDVQVVVPTEDLADPAALAGRLATEFGRSIAVRTALGAATAVGNGVGSRPEAMRLAREAIRGAGVRVQGGFGAADSVSCLVAKADVQRAVRALHAAFLEVGDEAPEMLVAEMQEAG